MAALTWGGRVPGQMQAVPSWLSPGPPQQGPLHQDGQAEQSLLCANSDAELSNYALGPRASVEMLNENDHRHLLNDAEQL